MTAQLPARLAVYSLLHDAHEAYLGDRSTPLKVAMSAPARAAMRDLERGVAAAIHHAFHTDFPLTAAVAEAVKHADLQLLSTERRDLFDTKL